MKKLEGKTAIITGAGGGLGEATARQFSEQGANLVLVDIQQDAVTKVAESLPNALAMSLDVADEDGWQQVVNKTVDEFGGLDILVNNAGIERSAPMTETSMELYNAVISTNQTGCFLGMKTAGKVMNEVGAIVNISSLAGMQGIPGAIAYVASKFAIRGMTKVAALELAHKNIRVNSVHPGGINTAMFTDMNERISESMEEQGQDAAALSMVALKRVSEPEEIARLVLYLASDDSSYSTGTEFIADGGILAGPSF